METIQLKRTRGPEVSFQGELVVRSEGNRDDKATLGRCHNISVFRKFDSGQWVVRIEYVTAAATEKPVVNVEVVDGPKDIELVLQMYVPDEHVDRVALRSLYEEARSRILKQVFLNYDRQVQDVLHKLSDVGLRPTETNAPVNAARDE